MSPSPDSPSTDTTKIWFITGCSSGLGRALAERALASGAGVFATARSPGSLSGLVEKYPETCWPLELDVTNREQVERAFKAVGQKTKRLDVLVNNAGYGLIGALEESSEDEIRRNFDTLVFGAINILQAALPFLRNRKNGRVIIISAAAAIANYPGFSIYGGAKYALEGISEALAAEVKPLGIRVTLIQPGPFRTEFVSRSLQRTATVIDDYATTAGKFRSFLEKMDGSQPGDPAKAAEAIHQITESEHPPLRLVLGKYAIDKTDRVLKSRLREFETWKELGLSTDYSA